MMINKITNKNKLVKYVNKTDFKSIYNNKLENMLLYAIHKK